MKGKLEKKMRFTICFALLFAYAAADTVVLNGMVDQLLESARELIRQANMDQMQVPDMNNEWHTRWHFIKISGHCNCHDGYVRSLASIQRTGDATMSTEGNKAVLRVRLGFGNLEFGFGKCQAKAHRLGSISSKVEAHVDSNSVDLQLSLTGQGASCVAALDHAVVDQLGSIKLHTGGGLLHKIEDKLLNWATKHFHEKIKNTLNEKLSDAVTRAIPKLDLCSKIPH